MAAPTRVLFALAVFVGLSVDGGFANHHPPLLGSGRIVGGRNASIVEFPYQVSLQHYYGSGSGGNHFCGGSIIDSRHVLTAGHCLDGQSLSSVMAAAGMTNVTNFDDPNRQYLDAEAFFIHDGFNGTTLTFDIAILRVAGEFSLDGTYLAAADLQSETPPTGTICSISGWGYVEQDGYYVLPDILQAVDLPLIQSEECAELYADYDDPNAAVRNDNVCAGLLEGGKDSCNGDSGGPMTCGGQLTGLVSWGDEVCGIPRYPGVYTDVAYYADWIADTLTASYAQLALTKLKH